jgi:hypothetical protein
MGSAGDAPTAWNDGVRAQVRPCSLEKSVCAPAPYIHTATVSRDTMGDDGDSICDHILPHPVIRITPRHNTPHQDKQITIA